MSGPDESIKQPENNLAVSHERTDTTQAQKHRSRETKQYVHAKSCTPVLRTMWLCSHEALEQSKATRRLAGGGGTQGGVGGRRAKEQGQAGEGEGFSRAHLGEGHASRCVCRSPAWLTRWNHDMQILHGEIGPKRKFSRPKAWKKKKEKKLIKTKNNY